MVSVSCSHLTHGVRVAAAGGGGGGQVVFGSGAVGKSSLTLRFVTDTFTSEYLPTVRRLLCYVLLAPLRWCVLCVMCYSLP